MVVNEEPAAIDLTPAAGSDFYYASLYHPPQVRHALHALEALRRELAAIPLDCSDRGVAHIKLAWWRDEITAIARRPARHALADAVAGVAPAEAVRPALLAYLEALSDGLAEAPLATREDVLAAAEVRPALRSRLRLATVPVGPAVARSGRARRATPRISSSPPR